MLEFLAACFPFLKSVKAPDHSLLPTDTGETVSGFCIFCHASVDHGFNVVWEDETFIAFHDYRPAARYHLQVIPKAHIASVKDLRKLDASLVRTMESIGHEVLDELNVSPSMRRMGFHIPPFNSVNHLHLHVHGLPYKSLIRSAKYPIVNFGGSYEKGFSWFVEVGQAIRILDNGGRVGVLPC